MPSIIWKRGVVAAGDAARRLVVREQDGKGWWPFSYKILETLENDYSEDDELLLTRLYSSLEAGSGIYKITKANRFLALDNRIAKEFRNADFVGSVRMHDAACSSGITSIELFKALASFPDMQFTASDYFHRIWLVTQGRWTIALDENGEPLQITGLRSVVSARRPAPARFPVNRVIRAYVTKFVIPYARKSFEERQANGQEETNENVRSVSLFHPLAIKLERSNPRFELVQHDLFRPLDEKVHCLRVMNFLTANHLNEDQIREVFAAVCQSVIPGGLLVVGRNRDESDGALLTSMYKVKSPTCIEKLWHLDGPWESESMFSEFIKGS